MQTKLTLRLEADLIEEAKKYAAKAGKSISQMVAEYFGFLTSKTQHSIVTDMNLPPVTRQLKGLLRAKKVHAKDYLEHLENKYL
ncbi:MAG: DUF6364 family protein [Myxococcaceae bacterium]